MQLKNILICVYLCLYSLCKQNTDINILLYNYYNVSNGASIATILCRLVLWRASFIYNIEYFYDILLTLDLNFYS